MPCNTSRTKSAVACISGINNANPSSDSVSSVVMLLVEYLLYLTLGDPFSEFDAGFELILQKKK